MEEKGILPNLFYEDSTTVIPKSEEDIKRKKKYRPICLCIRTQKSSVIH